MATAEFNRMMLWTDLEDTVVGGRWRIVRLVRPEGRLAWFEAASLDGKPVMLSITETLNDDDELLARLRAAAEICHPNVVRITNTVADCIDDSPVVIAAMERTEENLEDVLRERPLSAAEAQAVLEGLVQGIAAIHGRGLVHGRMEPSSVLAVGDSIKLRSDCLQLPETGFAAAASANVQGIGRIVSQAMTRRDPHGENDPVLQLLPEPLARAVRRALSGHARVDEIAALAGIRIVPATHPEPEIQKPRLPVLVSNESASETTIVPSKPGVEPNVNPDQPKSPKDSAEKAAKPVAEKSPLSVVTGPANDTMLHGKSGSLPSLPAPALTGEKSEEEPVDPRQARLFAESDTHRDLSHLLADDEEPVPLWRKPSAPWVLGGAAGILLVTIFTLVALLHRSPAAAAPASPVVVTQRMQSSAPRAASVAGIHAQQAPAPPRTAAPQAGWRVIAWTYDHEVDAQRKADALAQKYPQLRPTVFSLRGRAPYLVTVGGVMTRDQAFALRREAVRLGLPRDTYAQNYR